MSTDKGFSSDDHVIISFLIEYVFPILEERNHIKWLRDVIHSYHTWNGLFKNERWHRDVIKEHHNTIMKEVTRRKKMLSVINERNCEYVLSRKRLNDDLLFVISRLGMGDQYVKPMSKVCLNNNEMWETSHRLVRIMDQLKELFSSNNPTMLVHFFCVLASVFNELKNNDKVRKSVTLYSFIDYVTLKVGQFTPPCRQTPNEVQL